MSKHPEVLWAQRSSETEAAKEKNVLYVTINLPDIVESSLQYDLTPTGLVFKAQAGTVEQSTYEFSIDFYKDIIPEESGKRLTSRSLALNLRKKDLEREYWPRLTKDKIKSTYIKTDFSKWVDEDEQEGSGPALDEDLDMGGFGAGGGLGGSGLGGLGGGLGGGGNIDFEQMMAGMNNSGGINDADAAFPESDSEPDDTPPPLESPSGENENA
ncbi:HSP20-like chaperone [Russula compacta]|nr:HSP20-like chaperone [Russula compacta]